MRAPETDQAQTVAAGCEDNIIGEIADYAKGREPHFTIVVTIIDQNDDRFIEPGKFVEPETVFLPV